MQIVEYQAYEIREDDGSKLEPEKLLMVERLMKVFQASKVNGVATEVGPRAALRMACAVLNNYTIEPLMKEHE